MAKVKTATFPAQIKGEVLFFSKGHALLLLILNIYVFIVMFLKLMVMIFFNTIYKTTDRDINIRSKYNVLVVIWTKKTPKQVFEYYFKRTCSGNISKFNKNV